VDQLTIAVYDCAAVLGPVNLHAVDTRDAPTAGQWTFNGDSSSRRRGLGRRVVAQSSMRSTSTYKQSPR
jgi:hypothetical protein